VTLANQIRGLAVVFGVRLPRALTAAFIDNALKASDGIAGLSAAMRGLIAARTAVMTAVAAIDADMRRMTRASAACRRLMTIPGVGQLTALAFVAAIDDPSRIRRSRDVGAYLGLVPRRYQSGEVDYTGGISKCGDRRVRTLLYEAASVMLTRYKGQLKLKDWAFDRQAVNDAQGEGCSGSPPRDHHARDTARWNGVRITLSPRIPGDRRPNRAPARSDVREGADDGADSVARNQPMADCDFNEPPGTQLTPSSAERARIERRHPQSVDTQGASALDPLENDIRRVLPAASAT
jgi:Transposase IS116/IS110/IS902 family